MAAPLARRRLCCHPQTPCGVVEEVSAEIGVDADGMLVVAFRIVAELARLRIPAERLDPERLWAHTCCELFIAPAGSDAYVEWNFSPNGQLARFEFSAYRQRSPSSPLGAAAWTRSARLGRALALDARAPLPPEIGGAARISLTAVVEDEAGALSYWALRHPTERPDFHHPGGFALALTLGAAPAIVDAPESAMKLGLERLLDERDLQRGLAGRRVALLGHPASVTRELEHALDAVARIPGVRLGAAFGPQHGLRGDKQDNMIESADFTDPVHGIPIFSLYGEVRRPTDAMMDTFDVLLVDLQDVGCRIYTFITTLRYVLEAAARRGKAVWILDRPNPAGRPIEGLRLRAGWESFVGAGPLPMRHGMTMGELARWFVATLELDVELEVVTMEGWAPEAAPGYGWPLHERTWVNPSPNAASLAMARCYAGTVMLEGTTLSEGRGTTRPLELFGAPDLDATAMLAQMRSLAPQWLAGCGLRECWFEPTFHKHTGALVRGLQLHVDAAHYDHDAFRPWRVVALAFKALRLLRPDYALWREFPYEYEHDRLAIDLINGSELLRKWVDDPAATPADLDALASADERQWQQERAPSLLYGTKSPARR